MTRLLRAGFAALLFSAVVAVAPTSAQTSLAHARVSAANATIYARCDASSPARAVITRGTEVSVEAVNEGWVSVFVESIGERGCLKRSELEASRDLDRAGDARRGRDIERTRAENPMAGSGVTRRTSSRVAPSGPPLRVSAYGLPASSPRRRRTASTRSSTRTRGPTSAAASRSRGSAAPSAACSSRQTSRGSRRPASAPSSTAPTCSASASR